MALSSNDQLVVGQPKRSIAPERIILTKIRKPKASTITSESDLKKDDEEQRQLQSAYSRLLDFVFAKFS